MHGELLWTYPHLDLDEPRLPDGAAITRPAVSVGVPGSLREYVAVVDSGSPISVADSKLFAFIGIDIESHSPVFEVALGLGGSSRMMPVFDVELELRPPDGTTFAPVVWRLQLGARAGWRLPFSVLLGQRGWFDRFPTTIDASTSSIHI